MADEDIKMLFEGDDRGLLRSFLAINGAVKQVDENLNEVGKRTKKINDNAKEADGTFSGLVGKAASVAAGIGLWETGFKLASSAVKALRTDYDELIKRQDAAGKAALSLAQLTLKNVGLSNIAASDTLRKEFSETSARMGVPTEQLIASYATTMSSGASHEDRMRMAKSLTAMNNLVDTDKIGGIAAELKAANPKVSGQDAVDLALVLNTAARGKSDVLEASMLGYRQFTEGGMDSDRALAMMGSMAGQGYNAKQIQTFAGMLGAEVSPVKATFGKRFGDKDRIQNKLAAMDINQRLDWAFNNKAEFETYFGKEAFKFLPALDPGKLSVAQGMVTSAYSDDLVGKYLKDAGQTQTFAMLEADEASRAANAARQMGTREDAITGQMRGMYYSYLNAESYPTMPYGMKWAARALDKYSVEFGSDEQARKKMVENLSGFYSGGQEDPQQQTLLRLIDKMDQLAKSLDNNTNKTDANTRATGSGTATVMVEN